MLAAPTTLFSRVARYVGRVACCLSTGLIVLPAHAAPVADPLAYGTALSAAASVASPVAGQHGMVVSAQKLASEVGARILAKGGNAADAAVAMGYALAVVYPAAGNLGGGRVHDAAPTGQACDFFRFSGKGTTGRHAGYVFGQ
jgi:gamma-glutamyltranspeptidase/glutathione hydrolase